MDKAAKDREIATETATGTAIAPAAVEGRVPAATRSILGWGVDADPSNDPTHPMRDRAKDPGLTKNWDRPAIQRQDVEILQSIEHIRRPAVVGTSTPPSGISGIIRRIAFRWSESNWMHWLLLMGADRVNMVEGIVQDLGRGKIPNIPAEMGIRAEWKHNKRGLARKVGMGLAVGLGIFALARRRKVSRLAKESAAEA